MEIVPPMEICLIRWAISWERVKKGKSVGEKLAQIENNFSPISPEKSIPALLEVLQSLRKNARISLGKKSRKEEIQQIILQCAGLWWEALSPDYVTASGDSLEITIEAIRRSPIGINLKSVKFNGLDEVVVKADLPFNQINKNAHSIFLPSDYPISQPYWLANPKSKGMFSVEDQLLIGKPENDSSLPVEATFEINGVEVTAITPTSIQMD